MDIGIGRVVREARWRCRRRHDLVDRRHRRDKLAPGGRILGGDSRYVVRQTRLRAGAQGVVHLAGDDGRGGHVLVGGGHRVRRHRDVREVVRRRLAASLISTLKITRLAFFVRSRVRYAKRLI